MTRRRIWTDDQFRRVLAAGDCVTVDDVVAALGLGPYSANRATVRYHALRLGLTLPDGRHARPRDSKGRYKGPASPGAGRGREAR